jgi:DNA-directed RNA polymerase subunit L/DNA-directed RNA polymerase alpha subunit
MNPQISNISEEDDVYKFTLNGINVSIANAVRRIILSEIPINVFHTETYDDNKCTIEINNPPRLHNEIIKQRLSCIPIHEKELDILPDKYILEVDVKNETDKTVYVTTEQFRIRNKTNGNYLTKEETMRIFPPCKKTNQYIDFVRLTPQMSKEIPGGHIKLQCEFSVSSAIKNSMFNVVSKCTYGNTPDLVKIDKIWESMENKLLGEESTKEEIEFQKRNFYMLDAQRHFVPDSFDYTIQTIGIYDNVEIVKKGCAILQNKFVDLIQMIESDIISIVHSETAMENCYDVVLENEDYTVGKVLEYILYERFYQDEKILSFCGFKKYHPHNNHSIVRIAFNNPTDKTTVRNVLKSACTDAQEVFVKMFKLF